MFRFEDDIDDARMVHAAGWLALAFIGRAYREPGLTRVRLRPRAGRQAPHAAAVRADAGAAVIAASPTSR
jgi:hypothetical protein